MLQRCAPPRRRWRRRPSRGRRRGCGRPPPSARSLRAASVWLAARPAVSVRGPRPVRRRPCVWLVRGDGAVPPGDALAPCSGGTPCASAWEHAHAPAAVVSAAAVVAAAAEPAGQLGPTDAAIAATDTAAMLGAARAAGCVPLRLGRVTAPERQLLHVGGGASSLLLDYRWATNEYRLLPFHGAPRNTRPSPTRPPPAWRRRRWAARRR